MNRDAVRWGGGAAALLGLGVASFAFAAITTSTPEAHVLRYLEALADDDLTSVARLAGLEPNAPLPLGDDGEPAIVRIIDRIDATNGEVRVLAEYGSESDAVTAIFTLTPGPAHLGVVPVWQFTRPPVASASVAVDQHDRLRANGVLVQTPGAGQSVELAAFVPSRITARVIEAHVQSAPQSHRLNGSSRATITLKALPTDRLRRLVEAEVERFLLDCTEQRVLLPTGCPFGRSVTDRVVGLPTWQLEAPPEISIVAGDAPGKWAVVGNADVRLTAQIQRLRDGDISDLDETLVASIGGELVLTDGNPQLTIYPPRD